MTRIEFNRNIDNLDVEIVLPSSKSITNRAYIIKKLAEQNFIIQNASKSSDSENLKKCIEIIDDNKNIDKPCVLDVFDAGTNMRFLTALLSIKQGVWILTGSERMKQRPIKDLVDALKSFGAEIKYLENDGYPPIFINGKTLRGGEISFNSLVSSQFVSSLLLIAPVLKNGLRINFLGKIVSYPYILMTLNLMGHFGICYNIEKDSIFVDNQEYFANDIIIEADWSSASYWYQVAALCKNSKINLKGLKKSNLQGDDILTEVFELFGVTTIFCSESVILSNSKEIKKSICLDCSNYPDLVPSIALTSAVLGISAKLTGIGHLAHKESDRIISLANEISKLGIKCIFDSDNIEIIGSELSFNKNTIFETHNDHRIAMSLAPLALKTSMLKIDNGEVVTKSYPRFWDDLKKFGFEIYFS